MTEQTSTATCKYPGCEAPPAPAAPVPGRPPEYCADPAHDKVTARLGGGSGNGWPTLSAAWSPPTPTLRPPSAQARVTGAEMYRQMRDLAGTLAGVADRLTRHRGHLRRHDRR